MSSNLTLPLCDPPFYAESLFPSSRGDLSGRYCVELVNGPPGVSCCLPCPITDWVYSPGFPHETSLANYISILSLALNAFLLLTFFVLPEEKSHRHYLSTGLTVSLILVAIAFVIPLGTHPSQCYNAITPDTMKTDLSCAFTGVFIELGAMGVVVWIMLRSIWTALRIMANFKRVELFRKMAIGFGIGLPILFMIISFSVTGVSYRLGNICVPSSETAIATWFAWLIIFAALSWLIQVITILFCLWKFASSAVAGSKNDPSTVRSATTADASITSPTFSKAETLVSVDATHRPPSMNPRRRRRVAWQKARKVLMLQWRSIVLAFVVINVGIYFGIVFIQQTVTGHAPVGVQSFAISNHEWFACLIETHGVSAACLDKVHSLGLSEGRAVGTLVLASFIGIVVFLLLIRGSMFTGWWQLIRNPKTLLRRGSLDSQEFMMVARRNDRTAPVRVDDEETAPERKGPLDPS